MADAALAAAWNRVSKTALGFDERMRCTPIVRPFDFESWIAKYERLLEAGGTRAIDDATEELIEAAFASGVHVTHPRHFGLFNPGVTPAAVVGEAIAALFNFQLSTEYLAPFACALERWTLDQLGARLGGPWTSSHFTNGGSEANLTGAACALTWRFPNAVESGVASIGGAPRIYVGSEAHDSFIKIGKVLGIGAANVIKAPFDETGRTDVEALARRIENDVMQGALPFMIVSTIGATASGAIDNTVALRHLAKTHRCWLHVDAAWAGSASLSAQRATMFEGVAQADSLTWDAHKWLCVPLPTGMYFTRHAETLSRAFGLTADYMPPTAGATDLFSSTLPWSRRSLGLKVFLTLVSRGWSGYEQQIEHQFSIGDYLRLELAKAGWEIVNDTKLPLVCFRHAKLCEENDLREAAAKIVHSGEFWLSTVRLGPRGAALRACITSPLTTSDDIDAFVDALQQVLSRR